MAGSWIVLAGEIDFSSVPHLTAALLDAADGSGLLHVDLADAYFCDLAALRTIIGLSQHSEGQQPLRRARSVVLHNVPVHVERVLRIVGWDTTPGLTIDTGRTQHPEPSNMPPARLTASPRLCTKWPWISAWLVGGGVGLATGHPNSGLAGLIVGLVFTITSLGGRLRHGRFQRSAPSSAQLGWGTELE